MRDADDEEAVAALVAVGVQQEDARRCVAEQYDEGEREGPAGGGDCAVLRENWPEQDCLIDWLHRHARSAAIEEEALFTPPLPEQLETLWRHPAPPVSMANGDREVAEHLLAFLA